MSTEEVMASCHSWSTDMIILWLVGRALVTSLFPLIGETRERARKRGNEYERALGPYRPPPHAD